VKKLDAYIAPLGVERNAEALKLARELRRAGLSVEVGDGSFRLKKSFEAADKVARAIVLLGEDEVASGILTVKTFATGEQAKVERRGLSDVLWAQKLAFEARATATKTGLITHSLFADRREENAADVLDSFQVVDRDGA